LSQRRSIESLCFLQASKICVELVKSPKTAVRENSLKIYRLVTSITVHLLPQSRKLRGKLQLTFLSLSLQISFRFDHKRL